MSKVLQTANTKATEKLCNLSNDRKRRSTHNAKMEREDILAGENLRLWREHRGMTQSQLADTVGTTGAVISLQEAGKRKLSPAWLARLADALETTPGILLEIAPNSDFSRLMMTWRAIPAETHRQALSVLSAFQQSLTII